MRRHIAFGTDATDDLFYSDLQLTCRDRFFEIVRQWRFKVLPLTSVRVKKTELPCVKHLAGKIFRERWRVDFVTQHRITKMMQMHSNLMCAATVQFAFNQDSPARSNEERDIQFWPRDRVVNSRSFFADVPDVVRFCSRLRLLSFRTFPVDQGEVNFFHCARCELFR